jgi:hypothetical protein
MQANHFVKGCGMEYTYRTRAFRLLAEDARLPSRTTRVLQALLTANPVALRGEPTIVPRAALLEAMCGDAANGAGTAATEDGLLEVLEEVADSYWRVSEGQSVSTGFFLDSSGLSHLSGFVHFQFDHDFVTILELISRQLRDDAERPT